MSKTKPPKAAKVVIDLLNEVLTGELTAINQYFLHGEMQSHWGYKALYHLTRKQALGEMQHAEELIERILFLEGLPNVQRLGKVNIGENVKEQLQSDLALENDALPRLRDGIALCSGQGDHGSRLILEKILASEEEHVDWLEAQLLLIEQVGLENYLAQQMGVGGD